MKQLRRKSIKKAKNCQAQFKLVSLAELALIPVPPATQTFEVIVQLNSERLASIQQSVEPAGIHHHLFLNMPCQLQFKQFTKKLNLSSNSYFEGILRSRVVNN